MTDIIGGVTGGIGGDNPLGVVTDIIGGVTGGIGGDNPLGVVTDIHGVVMVVFADQVRLIIYQ
ncbi:hypothetical protein [Acinetobacter baumannii]|uniref:hypothetical protein n=1 Tax=Acinetobacter baumannii TaxID=470 RepID=UPI002277C101|nr:hypothetical protein [Acinetobacter baumannii]